MFLKLPRNLYFLSTNIAKALLLTIHTYTVFSLHNIIELSQRDMILDQAKITMGDTVRLRDIEDAEAGVSILKTPRNDKIIIILT